jgi:uncharacterized protein YpmB
MFNGFYGCVAVVIILIKITIIIIIIIIVVIICIYLFTNPTAYNPITRSPQRQKGTSKLESNKEKTVNRLTQRELASLA